MSLTASVDKPLYQPVCWSTFRIILRKLLPKAVKQRYLSRNWEIELCKIQSLYFARDGQYSEIGETNATPSEWYSSVTKEGVPPALLRRDPPNPRDFTLNPDA